MTLASASAFLVPIANPEISRLVYNNEGWHPRLAHDIAPRLRNSATSKLALRLSAVLGAVMLRPYQDPLTPFTSVAKFAKHFGLTNRFKTDGEFHDDANKKQT